MGLAKGTLSASEKRIVKAFLAKGWRNQDIQAFINEGRQHTINSARITEVKQDPAQELASNLEVQNYEKKKKCYDPRTGLNPFEDERLIRAREAMILAVQVFNNPLAQFKTEVFSVLANIAWTYLLHEYLVRNLTFPKDSAGRTPLLSKMSKEPKIPLSQGMRNNLSDLKEVRDEVEHELFGDSDDFWAPHFQACCLNFEKFMCDHFGQELSLTHELSFSLQFARMSLETLASLNENNIPANIQALDARLMTGKTEEQLQDLEYRFRVVFTMDSATKGTSNIKFISPGSEQGKNVRNMLVNYRSTDDKYPFKPRDVVNRVDKEISFEFKLHLHTQAWKFFKARPVSSSKDRASTNNKFCVYHQAHGDYTYSKEWIEFLIYELSDQKQYNRVKAYK